MVSTKGNRDRAYYMSKILMLIGLLVISSTAYADSCEYGVHISGSNLSAFLSVEDLHLDVNSDMSRKNKCDDCLAKLKTIPLEKRKSINASTGSNYQYKKLELSDLSDVDLNVIVNDGTVFGIECDDEFAGSFHVPANY